MSVNGNRKELINNLNQAVQRLGNQTVLFTNALAQRVGLTATEFECFSLVWEKGPFSAGELASLCGLSSGGITGLVDRLEKAGFVQRTNDPTDRRRVIIESAITSEMSAKISNLYAPVGAAFDELVKKYNEAELAAILDYLERSSSMVDGCIRGLPETT